MHGQSDIHIEGNVIYVKLTGAFNEEGCKLYVEKVKSVILGFNNAPVKMLIDNCDLEGGTPDAYKCLDEYNIWCRDQNIIAKAIVTENIPVTSIIQKNVPSFRETEVEFFTDKEKALLWLDKLTSDG